MSAFEAMNASSHHLIVGGQRSGKSRHAERLAQAWLAADPAHRVTVVATAEAWDDEMRERIERHRAERPAGIDTVEAPRDLCAALQVEARPGRLIVVDCLTLWLTNLLMPAEVAENPEQPHSTTPTSVDAVAALLAALRSAPGPVVLVSNEIGLGVIPMGEQVRHFVYTAGQVNQAVAAVSQRVVLMVAGLPLGVKT